MFDDRFVALTISSLFPFLYFLVSAHLLILLLLLVFKFYEKCNLQTLLKSIWYLKIPNYCLQIRDLHIAKREEDIGYCAGYVAELMIVATYLLYSSPFCSLTSVFLWRGFIDAWQSPDINFLGNGGWYWLRWSPYLYILIIFMFYLFWLGWYWSNEWVRNWKLHLFHQYVDQMDELEAENYICFLLLFILNRFCVCIVLYFQGYFSQHHVNVQIVLSQFNQFKNWDFNWCSSMVPYFPDIETCINSPGNYSCQCPKGYKHEGMDEKSCIKDNKWSKAILLIISLGMHVFFLMLIYCIYKPKFILLEPLLDPKFS